MNHGIDREDRTGTGTRSIFGYQMHFHLQDGFPLVNTKKTYMRPIVEELLWFLSGSTNEKELSEKNVKIWKEWATENGDLGPIYGNQWRSWGGTHDQIKTLLTNLKKNPYSRRHIVSTWNVSDLPDESVSPQINVKNGKMALAPCHTMFQFYVANNELSCSLYQRSADVFLGVPFNIASYALLTHMIAHVLGYNVGKFVHTLGDAHLYLNHFDQAHTLLSRSQYDLPQLELNPEIDNLFDFKYEDISLHNYLSHPAIKAPIAV